jgi:hypothetical protein
MSHLTVSDVARRLGVRPRDISDLFYQRRVSDELCPIVAGRRLIAESCLSVIVSALRECGVLPQGPEEAMPQTPAPPPVGGQRRRA